LHFCVLNGYAPFKVFAVSLFLGPTVRFTRFGTMFHLSLQVGQVRVFHELVLVLEVFDDFCGLFGPEMCLLKFDLLCTHSLALVGCFVNLS